MTAEPCLRGVIAGLPTFVAVTGLVTPLWAAPPALVQVVLGRSSLPIIDMATFTADRR